MESTEARRDDHLETGEVYRWHAHPLFERRGAGVVAVVIILVLAGVTAISFGLLWAVFAFVVLCLVLNRFFFPSRFGIDQTGITASYPLRRVRYNWRDLRRFVHDQYGAYLSTRAKRSILDAYTGMHILFGDHRAEVIQRIRHAMNRENQK